MTTTAAAALQAHVSVATIRTWCRTGVIAATKHAGRWVIDTASLAHRIAIGAMRVRKAASVTEPRTYTLDELKQLPIDERRTIRLDAIARAEQTRARIRTAVVLPALTGTDKQIAAGTDARQRRIDAAVDNTTGTRFGRVALRLTMHSNVVTQFDPLLLCALKLTPWETDEEFPDEDALVATLNAALAAPGRERAAWWLNARH